MARHAGTCSGKTSQAIGFVCLIDLDCSNFVLKIFQVKQCELLLFQNIETDGASSATSFRVNEKQYLFITNFGASGHYQTMSRLYRVGNDGRLQVVSGTIYLPQCRNKVYR